MGKCCNRSQTMRLLTNTAMEQNEWINWTWVHRSWCNLFRSIETIGQHIRIAKFKKQLFQESMNQRVRYDDAMKPWAHASRTIYHRNNGAMHSRNIDSIIENSILIESMNESEGQATHGGLCVVARSLASPNFGGLGGLNQNQQRDASMIQWTDQS